MEESLLSIGELAARSGLSPKALRLYDESSLLVPRRVDPSTGYRSYGVDQVGRARLIASLRGLGMSLARIRVLCDLDGAAAATELRSWWRQEEADALSRAAADGFHEAGDLAARMLAAFADSLESALDDPSAAALPALETAWSAAEALVPAGGGAGSTLTAALLDGYRLHIAHLGDTRVVLVRGDRVEHVTQDHTHVRSLLEAGRLSPEEAASHPDRQVLNRALAAGAPSAPDLLVRQLEPGDLVLVASDGLHAVVDPSVLAEALTDGEDPEVLAGQLVELALDAGGPDNIALALARV